jgi:hypothetical protein
MLGVSKLSMRALGYDIKVQLGDESELVSLSFAFYSESSCSLAWLAALARSFHPCAAAASDLKLNYVKMCGPQPVDKKGNH